MAYFLYTLKKYLKTIPKYFQWSTIKCHKSCDFDRVFSLIWCLLPCDCLCAQKIKFSNTIVTQKHISCVCCFHDTRFAFGMNTHTHTLIIFCPSHSLHIQSHTQRVTLSTLHIVYTHTPTLCLALWPSHSLHTHTLTLSSISSLHIVYKQCTRTPLCHSTSSLHIVYKHTHTLSVPLSLPFT